MLHYLHENVFFTNDVFVRDYMRGIEGRRKVLDFGKCTISLCGPTSFVPPWGRQGRLVLCQCVRDLQPEEHDSCLQLHSKVSWIHDVPYYRINSTMLIIMVDVRELPFLLPGWVTLAYGMWHHRFTKISNSAIDCILARIRLWCNVHICTDTELMITLSEFKVRVSS